MKKIKLNEISGFQTGHMTDTENATGVTVILAPEGATAGVDIRGGGPATRETALLNPVTTIQQIHAVVLSGGSAFGLEAGSGVMDYCKEQGYGFRLGEHVVPIVCQASLFDLGLGNPDAYPDKKMGYQAAENAEKNECLHGNVGAGTGASVGKLLGFENSMKSGLGSCAYEIGPLQVGAIVAVNACGDVYRPDSQERLAGIFNRKTRMNIDTEEAVLALAAQNMSNANTTIACILTNGDFNQAQMTKLAAMAQNALARTIRPVHTLNDGDTVFAMTTNQVEADLNLAGVLAVKALSQAIVDAVTSAEPAYGLESYSSIQDLKKKK